MPAAPKQVPLPGAPEYQPYEVPEPVEAPQVTAPPPAQAGDQTVPAPRYGFGRGATGALGTAAFLATNFLRGYAGGKAATQAKMAMNVKRVADGLHAAYEMAAKNYYQLFKSRIDQGKSPNDTDFMTPELQQAAAAKDASWAAMMKYISTQVMGPAGQKKGKKGGGAQNGQQQQNPLAGLQSQDPVERAQAWLAIAMKVGPDVDIQTKELASRTGMGETKYAAQRAENLARGEDLKKQLADEELRDVSAMSPEDQQKHADRLGQLRAAIADVGSAAGGAGGVKVTAPRQGKVVTGADLIKVIGENAPGPNGPIKLDPNATYYPVFTGEDSQGNPIMHYEPSTAAGQTKTIAEPGTGRPILVVFNPYNKQVSTKIADVPQKGQYIKIMGHDAAGNPTPLLYNYLPQYRHQFVPPPLGYTVDRPVDVGSEGGGQVVDETGTEIPVPATSGTIDQPNVPQYGVPAMSGEKKKSSAGTPTTTSDHVAQIAQDSNVPGTLVATFSGYSKANQDKGAAIAAQELTLNGMPGSKTDIGLRRSTLNVLKNKKDVDNLAVAMRQLEDLTKGQATAQGVEDGPGWLSLMKDRWSAIPAVRSAIGELSQDGKAYLTNYFRAWTNAATIRALQGATGKPTQAMYAILANELPTVGINVNNETEALRVLDSLQHDVDVAKDRLPQDMKDEINHKFPRTAGSNESAAPSVRKLPQGEAEDPNVVIQRLIERHATGVSQPAAGQPNQ
jgi:hypothetical protein